MPGPELVEVLQEPHPAFRRVIIRRLNVESIRLWAHAPDSSTARGICKKGFRMAAARAGRSCSLRRASGIADERQRRERVVSCSLSPRGKTAPPPLR